MSGYVEAEGERQDMTEKKRRNNQEKKMRIEV